jgi:protease PrsW
VASAFTHPALFIVYALVQMLLFFVIIRLLDAYEREPLWLVALMGLWGGTFAVGLAIVGNEAIIAALPEDVSVVFGAAIAAPIVEELVKGLALLLAFFGSHWFFKKTGRLEFEGVTDGIVYGAAVGFGFAFTEDILYFFNFLSQADVKTGLDVFLLRVDFFGLGSLGHAIYTGTFGAGLGMGTWALTKRGQIGWPLAGLAAGMFMHFLHNGIQSIMMVREFGLEATAVAYSGGLLPIEIVDRMNATVASAESMMNLLDTVFVIAFFTAIFLWVRHQKKVIAFELAEEVNNGTITKEEWAIVPNFLDRTKWYWQLLRQAQFETLKLVSEAHREMADLAFAKWRVRRRGADQTVVDVHRDRIRKIRARQAIHAS